MMQWAAVRMKCPSAKLRKAKKKSRWIAENMALGLIEKMKNFREIFLVKRNKYKGNKEKLGKRKCRERGGLVLL